jgi:hypothetical protein
MERHTTAPLWPAGLIFSAGSLLIPASSVSFCDNSYRRSVPA